MVVPSAAKKQQVLGILVDWDMSGSNAKGPCLKYVVLSIAPFPNEPKQSLVTHSKSWCDACEPFLCQNEKHAAIMKRCVLEIMQYKECSSGSRKKTERDFDSLITCAKRHFKCVGSTADDMHTTVSQWAKEALSLYQQEKMAKANRDSVVGVSLSRTPAVSDGSDGSDGSD